MIRHFPYRKPGTSGRCHLGSWKRREAKKNTGQHLERTCRTGSPHCCCCCCSVAPAVIRDFESAVRDGRGKQDVCLKTTRRQAATMRQRGNGSQCTVVVCRSFRHASQPVPFGALQQTPRAPCTHPCQAQNGFIVILNCTLRALHPHLSPPPLFGLIICDGNPGWRRNKWRMLVICCNSSKLFRLLRLSHKCCSTLER